MKEGLIAILAAFVIFFGWAFIFSIKGELDLKNRAVESNCAKYIVDEKTGATQFVFKGEEGWIE